MNYRNYLLSNVVVGLATALVLTSGTAMAQDAGQTPEGETEDAAVQQTVVVQGFRASLAKALDVKRDSTVSVDAIVAEDIADFPDLNLAESLNRIPGVAITRSQGEGKNITVRGLSGRFTRTQVNGMETRASTEQGTSRDFDFNMFASELFNSIIVQKSASANVDEGSLGATINLRTARALDYKTGLTFVVGGNIQYNTLSEDYGPRLTSLIAWHDPSDKFGVSASIAYQSTESGVNSGNTVRWQKARFRSVGGVECPAGSDGPAVAACDEVTDAFHARIPRYASDRNERERIGATFGLQWRPSANTDVSFDALLAKYDRTRTSKTLEVLFRSNEAGMDIVDYEIEPFPDRYGEGNNTLSYLAADNVWVRSENFLDISENTFEQYTLNVDHAFSDNLELKLRLGTSKSVAKTPQQTTFMYDDRDYDGYSYDFRQSDEYPTFAYNGPDVKDGSIYTVTEIRDTVQNIESTFDNATADLKWTLNEAFVVSGGVSYKKFAFDKIMWRRDGSACRPFVYDCDVDDDGIDDLPGIPGTQALSEIVTYEGDYGPGTSYQWATPSMSGWADAVNLFDIPLILNQGNTSSVEEENLGGYIQVSGEIPISTMRLLYDAGVRYVETKQNSSGYNSGTYVTVEREPYEDTLPSANLALWINDELVVRGSAAKVMSRPALGDLSPGGSINNFDYAVNFQNPSLDPTRANVFDASVEWYFADEGLLSVALFYKDIESFPIRELTTGTYASTGLPLSILAATSPAAQSPEGPPNADCNPANGGSGCWDITTLVNGPGAELQGLEVAFQTPFDALFGNLPPIVRDMGVILNYTYVDSDVDYTYGSETVTERLMGLSNGSYNATLYYEGERLKARIAYANRSDYLTGGPNASGNLWEFVEDVNTIDFSSSYQLNDNIQLSFEALNLTDEPFDWKVDETANRRYEYSKFGRTFIVGARYTF